MRKHISFEEYMNSIMINSFPPGKIKITEALIHLLGKKTIHNITIAEISKQAGVAETLIYKYYKNKQELLFCTIGKYAQFFFQKLLEELEECNNCEDKIRKSVSIYINTYNAEMTFARVMLLEVRDMRDYYSSDLYDLFRSVINQFSGILKEAVENGEVRDDLDREFMAEFITGGLERICRKSIIENKKLKVKQATDSICNFVLKGIRSD